jgi:hypothetical protein
MKDSSIRPMGRRAEAYQQSISDLEISVYQTTETTSSELSNKNLLEAKILNSVYHGAQFFASEKSFLKKCFNISEHYNTYKLHGAQLLLNNKGSEVKPRVILDQKIRNSTIVIKIADACVRYKNAKIILINIKARREPEIYSYNFGNFLGRDLEIGVSPDVKELVFTTELSLSTHTHMTISRPLDFSKTISSNIGIALVSPVSQESRSSRKSLHSSTSPSSKTTEQILDIGIAKEWLRANLESDTIKRLLVDNLIPDDIKTKLDSAIVSKPCHPFSSSVWFDKSDESTGLEYDAAFSNFISALNKISFTNSVHISMLQNLFEQYFVKSPLSEEQIIDFEDRINEYLDQNSIGYSIGFSTECLFVPKGTITKSGEAIERNFIVSFSAFTTNISGTNYLDRPNLELANQILEAAGHDETIENIDIIREKLAIRTPVKLSTNDQMRYTPSLTLTNYTTSSGTNTTDNGVGTGLGLASTGSSDNFSWARRVSSADISPNSHIDSLTRTSRLHSL